MARLLVNVDVPDLAEAERFYVRAFGLRVGRRFGEGAVELLGAEAPLYLLRKSAGTAPHASATAVRDYARHWTPVARSHQVAIRPHRHRSVQVLK